MGGGRHEKSCLIGFGGGMAIFWYHIILHQKEDRASPIKNAKSHWQTVVGLVALLLIAGCQNAARDHASMLLASTGNSSPRPDGFFVCSGHGCRHREKITFSQAEWTRLTEQFLVPARHAEEERLLISHALGEMEKIVGQKNGTDRDRGGTFEGAFAQGQLDCEDESLNTTLYLTLFYDAGLLRFHHVSARARRGYFINGWPHMTATIEEKATGQVYVADSWFDDNGMPAFIAPLAQWKNGARP